VVGLLPSQTPLGNASLVASYNGAFSAPVQFTVSRNAFGAYTRNNTGSGPGVLQNFNSQTDTPPNSMTQSAHPGQSMILWGTGLGAVNGSDAQPPAQVNFLSNLLFSVRVFVGTTEARVTYAGRGPDSGIDVIVFQVPATASGCNVSVTVSVNGNVSNITTMAVATGDVCSDPLGLGAADIAQIQQTGSYKAGTVTLTDLNETVGAGGQTASGTADSALGTFNSQTLASFLGSSGGPSFGSCTMSGTWTAQGAPPTPGMTPLDSGPALTLVGPNGSQQLALSSTGIYNVLLSKMGDPAFLTPGQYQISNGSGGAAIGAFQAALTIPSGFKWTNEFAIDAVTRSQDLDITWSGADPAGGVLISGLAMDPQAGVALTFGCLERATAGHFTIPSFILLAAPVTQAAILSVQAVGPLIRFSTSGLDFGTFQYSTGFSRNISLGN
jgi:uncharacterized protein (TIGR03437 family)